MFEHSIQLIDFQDKKFRFLFNFYDLNHSFQPEAIFNSYLGFEG